MANATIRKKPAKKPRGSGDFSVIEGESDSLLQNTSWPSSVNANLVEAGPAFLRSEEFYNSGSHYALATAYDRVSKKLAEAEKRNQQLRQEASLKDQFQVSKMSESTNYNLPSNLEDSVNQAWEAYNEKCKECQQLREELEDFKHRANNSDHFSKIQDLQEDVLREKAKQDDVVRKLERTKMEADHLGEKEMLAREELEKEREYLKTLKLSAEKKHREMEQRIEELEKSLANEKSLTDELRRREKDRAEALEEDFLVKQDVFKSKIRELEELNISLKEEVAILISMQAGASNSTGPNSRPVINGPSIAPSSISNESDANIASLEQEIHSLQSEMKELRKRANEQSLILTQLCQNPKLSTLFQTIQQMSSSKSENCANQRHKLDTSGVDFSTQSHEELVFMRKKTNSPKMSKSLVIHNNHGDNCSSPKDSCDPTSSQDKQKNASKPNDSSSSSIMPAEEFIRSLAQEGLIKKGRFLRPSQPSQNAPHSTVLDVSRMIHTPESSCHTSESQNMKEISGQAESPLNRVHAATIPMQPQCGCEEVNAAGGTLANGEKGMLSASNGAENSHIHAYASLLSNANTGHLTPIPAMRSNVILAADNSGSNSNRASHEVETPSNRYVGSSSDEDNTSDDAFTQLSDDFQPKEFVVPKVIRPPDNALSHNIAPEARSNPRPSIRARAEVSSITPRPVNQPKTGISGVAERHLSSDSRHPTPDEHTDKCPICGFNFTPDWSEIRMSFHINAHFSDEEQTNNLMSFE